MATDGVPLWIGDPEALHSAENLRLINYMIFRGQEGFLTTSAGKCKALEIPGGAVTLDPGAFIVNSAFPGGEMQSYLARILTATQVDTTANTTNTTRYDLVVCNIEDPVPSGGTIWNFPGPPGSSERQYGPYWRPRIIENVPPNTVCLDDLPTNREERQWSAIPSAILTRPPFSNVVQSTQIKPLNSVCNPFNGLGVPASLYKEIGDLAGTVGGVLSGRVPIPGEFQDVVDCTTATDGTNTLQPGQLTFKRFPKEAVWKVLVPPWATYCEIFAVTSNVYQKATGAGIDANVYGATRALLGTYSLSAYNEFDQDEINSYDNRAPSPGDSTAYNATYRPGNRITLFTSTGFAVDSRDRNKSVNLQIMAAQYNDPKTKGKLICDASSSVYVLLRFKEKPS